MLRHADTSVKAKSAKKTKVLPRAWVASEFTEPCFHEPQCSTHLLVFLLFLSDVCFGMVPPFSDPYPGRAENYDEIGTAPLSDVKAAQVNVLRALAPPIGERSAPVA